MITLKTLAQATTQEVFNQITAHLLKQNEKSMVGLGCAYRSELLGLKCAAGCLISDTEYTKEMDEGESGWDNLIEKELVPSTVHDQLIIGLQYVHDCVPAYQWSMVLKNYADNNNLEWNF